jgi:glycosyltransferase involved in cell wall biosynthesis
MTKIIDFKVKTKLITKLLEDENITKLPKKKFLGKVLSNKEFAPFYFHTGSLDKDSIEKIQRAEKVFVNSLTMQAQFINELDIPKENIEVIYPSVDVLYEKPKEVKKRFCQKFEIDKKKKIIFFTAKIFKNFGIKEFISIILQLSSQNFLAVVAGDKKQIENLKFQISKLNLEDKLLLLEDYDNMDELFLASDIFILPTHTKSFASNILKAMFCKCAVFTTANNDAKELVDIFSTMETPHDRSMQFKVDALLQNKDDLKLIKKENRKIAKNYTLDKNFAKVKEILSK